MEFLLTFIIWFGVYGLVLLENSGIYRKKKHQFLMPTPRNDYGNLDVVLCFALMMLWLVFLHIIQCSRLGMHEYKRLCMGRDVGYGQKKDGNWHLPKFSNLVHCLSTSLHKRFIYMATYHFLGFIVGISGYFMEK